jgi:hypothetical protein
MDILIQVVISVCILVFINIITSYKEKYNLKHLNINKKINLKYHELISHL